MKVRLELTTRDYEFKMKLTHGLAVILVFITAVIYSMEQNSLNAVIHGVAYVLVLISFYSWYVYYMGSIATTKSFKTFSRLACVINFVSIAFLAWAMIAVPISEHNEVAITTVSIVSFVTFFALIIMSTSELRKSEIYAFGLPLGGRLITFFAFVYLAIGMFHLDKRIKTLKNARKI